MKDVSFVLQELTNIVIKGLISPVSGNEDGDMSFVSHLPVESEELCRVVKILHIDSAQHISIPKTDLFIETAPRNPGDPKPHSPALLDARLCTRLQQKTVQGSGVRGH